MLNNAFELENAFRNNLDMPRGKKSRMLTSKNEFMSNDKSQYRLKSERRDSTSSASFSNETTTNTSPCSSSTNVRCHSDEKMKRNHQHSTDRLFVMKKKTNRNYDDRNKVNKKKSKKSSQISKNFHMISNELYKTGQYFNSQRGKKDANKENNLFGLSWSSRRSLNHNRNHNNNNGKDNESRITTSKISTSHCPLNTEADKLYCHPMKKLNSYCDNDTHAIMQSSSGSDQDSNSKGTSTTSERNELDMEQYKKIKFSKSGNFKRSIIGIFVLIILTSFIILSALFFLGRNHFNSTFFNPFSTNLPEANYTSKNFYSKYVRNHTIEVSENAKDEEKQNLIHLVNQILFGYSNDTWTNAPMVKKFNEESAFSSFPPTENVYGTVANKHSKEFLTTTKQMTPATSDEEIRNYDQEQNEDKIFEINSVKYFVVNETEDKIVTMRRTSTSTSTKSTKSDTTSINEYPLTPVITTKIDKFIKQAPFNIHNFTQKIIKHQISTTTPTSGILIDEKSDDTQSRKTTFTSTNVPQISKSVKKLTQITSTTLKTSTTTTLITTSRTTTTSTATTTTTTTTTTIRITSTTSTTSSKLKVMDKNALLNKILLLNNDPNISISLRNSQAEFRDKAAKNSESDDGTPVILINTTETQKDNKNFSSVDIDYNLVIDPILETNSSTILDLDSIINGNFSESSSDFINVNVTESSMGNKDIKNVSTSETASTISKTDNRVKRKNSKFAVSIFKNLFNLNDTSIF